jgi:hypothetical protein
MLRLAVTPEANGNVLWPWGHAIFGSGPNAGLISGALGLILGWIAPAVIGDLLVLTAGLCGLGILLAIIAAAAWFIWIIVAAMVKSPSPSETKAPSAAPATAHDSHAP